MQIKIQHGSGLPFTLMNDHVMFDSNKNQYKEIKGKCTNIKGEITLKAAGKETFKAYQQSAHGLACQHSCCQGSCLSLQALTSSVFFIFLMCCAC